jgi:hypothetical protein
MLAHECPWIDVGKLARYYEHGRGIEGEFVVSWDQIEQFYQSFDYPLTPAVLHFITHVREHGYDTVLRVGQSMVTLIVSRSRRHGLSAGQPHIRFEFHRDGLDIEYIADNTVQHMSQPTIEFTAAIDQWLSQLAAKAID